MQFDFLLLQALNKKNIYTFNPAFYQDQLKPAFYSRGIYAKAVDFYLKCLSCESVVCIIFLFYRAIDCDVNYKLNSNTY